MKFEVTKRLSILSFDTECRPMHYNEWRPESQITAIAWSWVGEDEVRCDILEPDLSNERDMIERFLIELARADIVTGHYIRKHDLPLIVDHAARLGLPFPRMLRVQDTKTDLVRFNGLGSSQENLAVTFGLAEDKHHMTGALWRSANSLTPEGKAGAKKRVMDDVRQQKALREELIRRRLLNPPEVWYP